MRNAIKTVDQLDKVGLHIKAVSPTGSELAKITASIIFGIGAGGVTLFEKLLFEKSVDETFSLFVTPGAGDSLFGHLRCSLLQPLGIDMPFEMGVTVTSIEKAEGHEVVKAMAKSTDGCGGGCGCGCDS
ncbi:MAG: hypothetical protein HKP58_13865 [Desulfatitalea sp.]|nr:hypothetical protein [Desulfatitalea sp.]NNK01489.1 hypothetical protein [Desulfatitalea sp.]